MRPTGLVVAPLRRRVLAGLIDGVVALAGFCSVVGLGAALAMKAPALRRRWRSRVKQRALRDLDDRPAWGSSRMRLAFPLLWLVMGVVGRNWRGPGFRMLHLRRVDADTGGPVAVRAAVVRSVVAQGRSAVLSRLFAPLTRRQTDRIQSHAPELKEIHARHRGDPEALNDALMEFYRENKLNPLASCGWILVPPLVALATDAPTLRSPLRQGLADRLAGTVVVIDR